MKKGFKIKNNKIAYYLDLQGKDISFNRYRIYAYYASHFAQTIMFNTEKRYLAFIERFKNNCWINDEYSIFRQYADNNLKDISI